MIDAIDDALVYKRQENSNIEEIYRQNLLADFRAFAFKVHFCTICPMTVRTTAPINLFLFLLIVSGTGSFGQGSQPRPTPIPTATPTPSIASPTPAATPRPVQTLATLQSFIMGRLARAEVRRGRVGIKIVSLNTGKVVFEQDADKYFMPASNMKNFTVATAMERLGPDYKFVTSVYAEAKPDANGIVRGNLRVVGSGDVSISTAFFGTSPSDPETYYKGIDRLVDVIAAAGVKRIEGDLIGDESHFKGSAIPGSWEYDDLQWYYGAEISALPINDNAVDLSVTPGNIGGPCVVNILPTNTIYQIANSCVTTPAATKRTLSVNKQIDRNMLTISGTIPVGDAFRNSITFSHPAELFISILKQRLEKRGIVVTGSTKTIKEAPVIPCKDCREEVIAKLESPPFREIAAKTMKPSQNMYTETILWTLGEEERKRALIAPTAAAPDSSDLGLGVVRNFLTSIGVPADGIVQHDGSGLSRHDLITPGAVVTLYTYMAKQSPNAQAWRDSLTIGGVDGTLANRFKGTAAAGNIRGKTGTIDQVSALSGYMSTAGGEPVVVSIVVNGVPEPRHRTSLIDDIVIAIANFDGKIDLPVGPN
jgi:serine-type D-Ala-D-Ala carboxypeptidase/endopeptidase (penicillin-binding protein 4)